MNYCYCDLNTAAVGRPYKLVGLDTLVINIQAFMITQAGQGNSQAMVYSSCMASAPSGKSMLVTYTVTTSEPAGDLIDAVCYVGL